jgi:hypothetical protein
MSYQMFLIQHLHQQHVRRTYVCADERCRSHDQQLNEPADANFDGFQQLCLPVTQTSTLEVNEYFKEIITRMY